MGRFLLFLFCLSAAVLFGFGAARWKKMGTVHKSASLSPFSPTQYPLQNRSFVVVMIGRNHGAYLEKGLNSIFSQNYDRFRIIYVDDGSDDGSFELASELIPNSVKNLEFEGHQKGPDLNDHSSPILMQYGSSRDRSNLGPSEPLKFQVFDRLRYIPNSVELIHRDQPIGFLPNLTSVVRSCSDEEIVVVLHGEDWLAHEWVLQRLNQYYANPDLWLTAGGSCDYPTFERSPERPFPQEGMRSFYAGLFKKVDDAEGYIEMAQDHFVLLPEVLYIVNRQIERAPL